MRLLTPTVLAILVAGCAARDERPSRPHEASLSEACVVAGNQCVKNIGDVAGCRASQATCLAMGEQIASTSGPTAPSIHPAGASANLDMAELMPPAAPTGEQPDDHADPATVAKCAAGARDMIETLLHGRIDRTLVTHSPRWGAVWRADFTVQMDGRSASQRYVCTQAGVLISPLEMFDPGQNLAPLAAQTP
jgi:hypothetical protein